MENNKLRKLQLVEFEMLKDFKKVCDLQSLSYFICSGTLLGAVRHHGSIPWDDDIDVTMPYNDYLKFLQIAQSELGERYFVQNSTTEDNFHFSFTKIRLNNTTFMDSYHKKWDIHHGIWIDIFPLIECDESQLKFKKILLKVCAVCQMENLIESHQEEFDRTLGKRNLFLLNIFYKIPLSIRKKIKKKLLHIICSSSGRSNYSILWSGLTAIYPKDIFNDPIELEYESEMFKAPKNFDLYLTIEYGDYMTIPPENERPVHCDIIDFDNNYSKYMEL